MRWGRPYGLRNNTCRMSAKRFSADMRPLYTRAQQGCAWRAHREVATQIASYPPVNGARFSDGGGPDCLSFNAGVVVTVSVAARQAQLIARD